MKCEQISFDSLPRLVVLDFFCDFAGETFIQDIESSMVLLDVVVD